MKSLEHGSGGGQAEINPQPGEGTAGASTWESLGTERQHLLPLALILYHQGDMEPYLSVLPFLTSSHLYTKSFSCVIYCIPSLSKKFCS